jgi:NitT/TauT family transport system substrate-binding protein
MKKVRLIAERALCYAPHHVADALGMFAAQGLDVETNYDSGPGGSWLSDRLLDGAADIARGGVWLPILYRKPLADLRLFALLCDRNPQLILARRRYDRFTLSDLEGQRVLLPAAATSQWMFLEGILRESGADLGRIEFIRDLEVMTMTRLWRAGFGDFILVSPPLSQELAEGGSVVAGSIAELGGRVPWSVYYARQDFLTASGDVIVAFNAALRHAQAWMAEHNGAETADLIAHDFPGRPRELLAAAISRMKADRVWVHSVRLPPDSLGRYQQMIAAYGLADAPLPYGELVHDDAGEP